MATPIDTTYLASGDQLIANARPALLETVQAMNTQFTLNDSTNTTIGDIQNSLKSITDQTTVVWSSKTGGWKKDAIVLYNGVFYRSTVDANTSTPGADANWQNWIGNEVVGTGDTQIPRQQDFGTAARLAVVTGNTDTVGTHVPNLSWLGLAQPPATSPIITSTSVATESAKGIVELATAAEALAGTDNTRAVHPAGLRNVILNSAEIIRVQVASYSGMAQTKGVWTTIPTYAVFTARSSHVDIDWFVNTHIYSISGNDSINLRGSVWSNSAPLTRLFFGDINPSWAVGQGMAWAQSVAWKDRYTTLTPGVTYRFYIEWYCGAAIGGWDADGGLIQIQAA